MPLAKAGIASDRRGVDESWTPHEQQSRTVRVSRHFSAALLPAQMLDTWLQDALNQAELETAVLRNNGAGEAASAREALVRQLMEAATVHYRSEVTVAEAAYEAGVCEETLRRKVRSGKLKARRSGTRGRFHVRRGDVGKLVGHRGDSYDPVADAQDIAKMRRG